MQEIPFHIWSHLEEIKLRGTYVNMAIDVDFILAMIIHECFKQNMNEIKTLSLSSGRKNKELHELTMFEKIDVCKQGLQKYNNQFYSSHFEEIEVLDKLRYFRNIFAHQKMDFKEPDKENITFSKLSKNAQVEMNILSRTALWNELNTYRASIFKVLDIIKSAIIHH